MKPYTLFFVADNGDAVFDIRFDDLNFALAVRNLIQISGAKVTMVIEDAQGNLVGL